jgi:hypothetical protein
MLTVVIGDVVGMTHRTGYTREGSPVFLHWPHRAVQSAMTRFHSGSTGTVHAMRSFLVEHPEYAEYQRFMWGSRCGQHWLAVDVFGRCERAIPYEDETPWCHACGSCELIARKEAEAELSRQRGAAWRAGLSERERRLFGFAV